MWLGGGATVLGLELLSAKGTVAKTKRPVCLKQNGLWGDGAWEKHGCGSTSGRAHERGGEGGEGEDCPFLSAHSPMRSVG